MLVCVILTCIHLLKLISVSFDYFELIHKAVKVCDVSHHFC